MAKKETVIVEIVESESGWGQKVDSTVEFGTQQEADDYCREYNQKHNPPNQQAPTWYMYARIKGDTILSGMRR